MSHEATSWALKQRGIKPAAKIVLWHLCDRFHPDHGCFPSLETLANDCEMSRRSVQNQIQDLEKSGFLRVEKMPRSEGQLPRNSYQILFENHLGQNLPSAPSTLGKFGCSPWANSGNHLGQNLPPNLVKGTCNITSKEKTGDDLFSEDGNTQTESDAFDVFWNAFPKRINPSSKKVTSAKFKTALKKTTATVLIGAARAYASHCDEQGTEPRFIKGAVPWLTQEDWSIWTPKDESEPKELSKHAKIAKKYRGIK